MKHAKKLRGTAQFFLILSIFSFLGADSNLAFGGISAIFALTAMVFNDLSELELIIFNNQTWEGTGND